MLHQGVVHNSRAVDQHLDQPQLFFRALHQRPYPSPIRDVGLHDEALCHASPIVEPGPYFEERLPPAPIPLEAPVTTATRPRKETLSIACSFGRHRVWAGKVGDSFQAVGLACEATPLQLSYPHRTTTGTAPL